MNNHKYFLRVINFILVVALILSGYRNASAKAQLENKLSEPLKIEEMIVGFTKTIPANGASVPMPATTYRLLEWTDALASDSDRYQYCIDQTNNNLCDSDNWITRKGLYSGSPDEIVLEYGKTYYWQVRVRDANLYANGGGAWWSFSISGSAPALTKTTPANGATISLPATTYYFMQWSNFPISSTDRYQYCVDTTNNNTCDANNWVSRKSLYSGADEISLTTGTTYYWQVRARDAGTVADGGTWWSFKTSGSAPVGLTKTVPANGATIPLPSTTYYLLQWTDIGISSTDRYQYCVDTTNNNTCDANNWVSRKSLYSGDGEISLTTGTTYYWQARARDAGTVADGGTWWSFKISGSAPAGLTKTTPANGATVSPSASTYYLLQWTDIGISSTDRYQYCIDTTNNNSCDANNWITRKNLYSGEGEFPLTPGATYYWQVRVRDAGTVADGGTWRSFTVTGSVPTLSKTTPSNGASVSHAASTYYLLQWTDIGISSTDRYQYCVDTTNNNTCDSNNWITRKNLYSGDSEFPLTPGSTYYWQVRVRDAGTVADGGTWRSFSVPAILTPPTVSSIVRTTPAVATTDAVEVTFTITFTQAVTGVDVSDFILTTTGVAGASIVSVGGTDNTTTRTITVNTGTGDGTIRLDLADNDTIQNNQSTPLGGVAVGNGNFASGETYTIDKP